MEKNTVIQNGKTTLEETRCHGLLGKDGSFRLLGYCGKRFPKQKAETQPTRLVQKKDRAA